MEHSVPKSDTIINDRKRMERVDMKLKAAQFSAVSKMFHKIEGNTTEYI